MPPNEGQNGSDQKVVFFNNLNSTKSPKLKININEGVNKGHMDRHLPELHNVTDMADISV